MTIMGGPAHDLGLKDTPIHVSRVGYIPQLKWLDGKFVLLWDELDKRGWLINGTSALLHVVRASLAHDSSDKFSSMFLFKGEDLQEASIPFTTASAVKVLANPRNLNMKLYSEDSGDVILKSRINHFYRALEKLIDHQRDICMRRSNGLRHKTRKHLEGWDFDDLARSPSQDTLHPRVATLQASGKGWVDFTRSIHAVTLLGRGFGEIIRPGRASRCEHWSTLPTQRYFIACCLSDLQELTRKHDTFDEGVVRLSEDLIWHTPATLFTSCECGQTPEEHDHEPVQTIFPEALSNLLPDRTHSIPEHGAGAVVFGYTDRFAWIWGDTGHPQKGELQEVASLLKASETDSESAKDSGIGLSLARSPSDGRDSFLSVKSPILSRQATSTPYPNLKRQDSTAQAGYPSYSIENYTVGIICALPKELLAVRTLFDQRHSRLETAPSDTNQYALGQIGHHMVVAACLPAGEYGTVTAATVASGMKSSFTIRFCLLVGIGGGVPGNSDVRLGDVVVSLPTGTYSGVIQYDLGKETGSVFERTGSLRGPSHVLTNAISALQSDPDLRSNPLGPGLQKIAADMPDYCHPGKELDMLHRHGKRIERLTAEPVVHYGLIASGNRLIKDSAFRDQLASEHPVLCFEMEAAGVLKSFDSLVIRGICDYCDKDKNDVWQNYASAAAASYAKVLLSAMASVGKEDERWGRVVKKRKTTVY